MDFLVYCAGRGNFIEENHCGRKSDSNFFFNLSSDYEILQS